jgi:hypothetical protein
MEHADLPVETIDGGVHVRLTKEHRHVVGEITRREVVGPVEDDVIVPRDAKRVFGGVRLVVDIHLNVGIQVNEFLPRAFHFEFADRGRSMNDLALQIGRVNHVVIHESDAANARRRKIQRDRRTKSACADDER